MTATPEIKVALAMQELAAAIDTLLTDISGERMGFALQVFPLNRAGATNYISNAERADMKKMLEDLLAKWAAGMGDIPLQAKH